MLIVFLVFCQCKSSQKAVQKPDTKAIIGQTIESYFNKLSHKDIDGAFDFIYPKLFDIVPKEMMVSSFEQLFSDTTFSFSFDSLIVTNISEPIKVAENEYAKVNYDGFMTMNLLGELEAEFIEIMKFGLNAQFGEEQIQFNESPPSFSIHSEKSMIAIREANVSGWTFLENNKKMADIYNQLIPGEVVEKLGL